MSYRVEKYAMILVMVDEFEDEQVRAKVRAMKYIEDAYPVTPPYHICVIVEPRGIPLIDRIVEAIKRIDGVASTATGTDLGYALP